MIDRDVWYFDLFLDQKPYSMALLQRIGCLNRHFLPFCVDLLPICALNLTVLFFCHQSRYTFELFVRPSPSPLILLHISPMSQPTTRHILGLISTHLHRETKSGSLILSLRVNRDATSVGLNYALTYKQTKADPFVIVFGRTLQLSKLLK